MTMTRRAALTSLTALAGATGMTMTPVTKSEAAGASLIILKSAVRLTPAQAAAIKEQWEAAMTGTDLAGIKVLIVPSDLSIEIVRGRKVE